ncbi:unnamed protein product [Gulo gulo]|uniref:Uncharacterized protein n=1 Tax=Gulo gulo TaxID=48420 RepID=A0A9X9LW04_GULGU|nr:unnamed protein product [Gulo gulo]
MVNSSRCGTSEKAAPHPGFRCSLRVEVREGCPQRCAGSAEHVCPGALRAFALPGTWGCEEAVPGIWKS